MKLIRYGAPGEEKPGLCDTNGIFRDLSAHVGDIDATSLSPDGLAQLAAIDPASLPIVDGQTRLGACVGNVGRMICIGLNYADHCAENGVPVPTEPMIFMKACPPTGADDNIILPKGSVRTDWEVELAVVIGSRVQHVGESEALKFVAGYALFNDVSERDFQLAHSGGTTKGKSCDSFAPIGPWLVTGDEIGDPQNLSIWLDVNRQRFQDGNTGTMVFSVAKIVSYLSNFLTLYPGDVISTGTPPGVGLGHRPEPVFLKSGDHVRLGIEGLGEQNHNVVAFGT